MAPARLSADPALQRRCCYRGFELIQRHDLSWIAQPQGLEGTGSFTTPPSSLADVKALIDWRLNQAA
jgi:hypothetical protein